MQNNWYMGAGAWINMTTDGPSGIGSGGAGVNPWIAYVAGSGQWFLNASVGDIAYRNTVGKLLFGNSGGNAAMAISGDAVGIGTTTPATSLDIIGDLTFRTNLSSPGFVIRDRLDEPGRQLDFEGNDGTAYTVFNVTTKGATTSSGKIGSVALWDTSIANVTNATQFQIQRSPTYGGILFTQKVGTGAEGDQPVSIQAGWNQASPPTQLVLGTNGNVGIGTALPAGSLDVVATSAAYAGHFSNTATTHTYGVYSTIADLTTGAALFGAATGNANTGYAGYFTNTSTAVVNYGLYASTSSSTGWAGYFDGAVNVAGNLNAANAAIGGTTTVNNITVTGSCLGCLAPGSNALSALTSATSTNSIDNAAYAQTWTWNSLSSGTAFTISSNSMTTGTLLSLQDTAASATATGKVLSLSDATTGAGYGVYSAMTGFGNTGYAGYFTNTDTGADANYGVYGTDASASGYGGYFANTSSTGFALAATGTSYFNGRVGIGTTAPADKLDVAGGIGLTTTTATAPLVGMYSPYANELSLVATGESEIDLGSWVSGSTTFWGNAGAAVLAIGNWGGGQLAQHFTSGGLLAWDSTPDIRNNSPDLYLSRLSTGVLAIGSTTTSNGTLIAGSVGIGTTSPGALLDLGLAGTTTGTLRLEGIASGYVQLQPASAAGSWTMTLPSSAGSNGYVLSTNGSGVTSWVSASSIAGGTPLSSLTSAAAVNSIDNYNNAQTWAWGTLSTETAMTLTTSSMKGGTLLSLQNTAAAATSTGLVLSVTDASTGAGFGVYSTMTATGNTGYAGYFGNSSTGTGYALYATITGSGNTGYAGYFNNSGAGYALAATGTSYFNGNVGIGTANPAYALEVSTTDATTAIGLVKTSGTYTGGIGPYNSGWTAWAAYDAYGNPNFVVQNGYFRPAQPIMALSSTLQLEARGDMNSGVSIGYAPGVGTAGTYPLLQLLGDASQASDILDVYKGASEVLVVTSTGSVGIGTTSPGALLEVNGTTQLDSTTTVSGALNATATVNIAGGD